MRLFASKFVRCVCLFAAAVPWFPQAASPEDVYVNAQVPWHPAVLDTQGKLLAWYQPEKTLGYDHVIRSGWDFIEHKVPRDTRHGTGAQDLSDQFGVRRRDARRVSTGSIIPRWFMRPSSIPWWGGMRIRRTRRRSRRCARCSITSSSMGRRPPTGNGRECHSPPAAETARLRPMHREHAARVLRRNRDGQGRGVGHGLRPVLQADRRAQISGGGHSVRAGARPARPARAMRITLRGPSASTPARERPSRWRSTAAMWRDRCGSSIC